MDPAARLLRLLSLLQARPTWSAAELSDRLEVDRRTVRRDIARLRDLGYPVESTPGVTGYRLGAGGRLPPLLLEDDDAVAIAVGLRLAATSAIAGIESAVVSAMAKLEQVLPAQVRERVRSLHASTIRLEHVGPEPADPEVLALLARGCRECERVHFAYRAFGDERTDRRVEPAQIVNAGRRWYLVGRDLDRDDWRTFRLDRIADAVLTGHRFERTEPADAARRARAALEYTPPQIQAQVVVDVGPEAARRRFSGDGTKVTAAPHDGSTLTIEGGTLDELLRHVLGLGVGFEVVSPPELRTMVGDYGTELARRHRPRR